MCSALSQSGTCSALLLPLSPLFQLHPLGQEGTEQGTQEGLSEHLGKANRPRNALDPSCTAPDTGAAPAASSAGSRPGVTPPPSSLCPVLSQLGPVSTFHTSLGASTVQPCRFLDFRQGYSKPAILGKFQSQVGATLLLLLLFFWWGKPPES